MSQKKTIISLAKNGVGAFVFPCRKMEFTYCERSGSSRGMIEYLKTHLIPFAEKNPQIEIVVTPRPSKHPFVRGLYLNGREKGISARNKTPEEIVETVNLIRDNTGFKNNKRFKKPVISTTPSVRGIWSPFNTQPHKI
ncbi:thioredoxin-like protein [Gigaspora rosea]|uniref:Large ribosomal subunit protein mL43 n=1 Tax=Gigaspora rosea TaxID=44941 RepID=A0A397U907_9GLOM|nr:thioredoxin-like protein [Gigaspora rosea]